MTDQPLIYNKLVRDLIPEKIAQSGKFSSSGILDNQVFLDSLRLKILEEAHELFHADKRDKIINVSAGLLELMSAILKQYGIKWDEVFSQQTVKHQEDGGFNKKLMPYATGASHGIVNPGDRHPRLPQLLTFNSLTGLVDVIKRELEDTDALYIASAFYSRGMLNLLLDPFLEFVRRGGKLRLLTSVMGNFNNPNDFLHLAAQIPEIDVKIFYPLNEHGNADFNQQPPPFHVKSFLFEKPTGQHALIVGSSNLTGSGLARNHEWNYFSNSETNLLLKNNLSTFQYARQEYESYWNESSVPVDDRFIKAYLPRWEKAHELRTTVAHEMDRTFQTALEPRPAQITALQSLADRRKRSIKKTAVIAATGLGKTYLAAFDFKQCGMRNVLFIAHRENILIKAMNTFREVMSDNSFGTVLSGSSKPTQPAGSLFAMVQTLSQPTTLADYADNAFDYIVIDEFHHAEATSYQRILEKFKPKFLLGLTATPERMDGRDVLKICDYDVAFETRLFDAIENTWLVPFQYFAIHDPTDYSSLRWTTSRGYMDSELDELLMHDTRAELVFNNLLKFLPSTGKIKALAFCSSKNHAEYMNRKFNELGASTGMRSICLLGQDSIEDRERAIQQLQDENDNLQIICSVDIFGEGIDIPAVSHVLFLRPTQSFTVFIQQLGRGLRQLPEKDYLVALDFVGNFRQSYVAALALRGYTSTEEYKKSRGNKKPEKQLPTACHVGVDTEVQRIWDKEIKRILTPANRIDALKELYLELRSSLGMSLSLMDFFANPAIHDPYVFLKEEKLGGNWLRVKSFMDDLTTFEATLIGTPAEELLEHIEKELSPVKSYQMVILKSLLALGNTEWSLDDIPHTFLDYYLENRDRLADWDELAKVEDPTQLSLTSIAAHLISVSLDKMTNTGGDFFALDQQQKIFRIQEEFHSFWINSEFQQLIADRVDFGLTRYFYRKDNASVLAENMRGFAVNIPYATKPDSGYSGKIRKVIADDPSSNNWEFNFGKKGYTGNMDLEIQTDQTFVAWTHTRYDDITRFPARIRAAATALFNESQYGAFSISARGTGIFIKRK